MNWVVVLYFLELGYAPFYGGANITEPFVDQNVFYINMEMEAIILTNMFIGGALKTYFTDKKDSYSFVPFEADYLFKAGIRIDNIEIGFRHFCLHPVRPYEMYYQPQGSTDGGYEEFYIRLSSKDH